jgi:tetratricopeptide (TPR) repeat protein
LVRALVFALVMMLGLTGGCGQEQVVEDCSQNKNPDRRIRGCTQIIELGDATPNYIAGAYEARGLAHHKKRDYDRAIADFDKAIELNPDKVGFHISKGISYIEKRDRERAIAAFRKALEIDPSNELAKKGLKLAEQE